MIKNVTLLIALVALGFAAAAFVNAQRTVKTAQADIDLRRFLRINTLSVKYTFPNLAGLNA